MVFTLPEKPQHLDFTLLPPSLPMPIRLIRRRVSPSRMLRPHMLRRIRPINILIRIRRPLRLRINRLPTPPRAATRAKRPEEPRDQRARDGQPHVNEHRPAEVKRDAVFILQGGVERGVEAGVGDGGEEDKGPEEGGGDEGGDGGEDAAEAAEEAADADEDFDACGDDGEDVEG